MLEAFTEPVELFAEIRGPEGYNIRKYNGSFVSYTEISRALRVWDTVGHDNNKNTVNPF